VGLVLPPNRPDMRSSSWAIVREGLVPRSSTGRIRAAPSARASWTARWRAVLESATSRGETAGGRVTAMLWCRPSPMSCGLTAYRE
jgi:hypothetical protein